MHTFKKGDQVYIINQSMGGAFFVEGVATIKKPVDDVDEQYVVDFGDFGVGTVERFVDPAAQTNPESFVAKLNSHVPA